MKQIDARKKVCPIPVVMAKEAMETEQEIQVIVDNFVAVQNIEKMARVKGYACSHAASGEDYLVTLSRNGQPDIPAAAQPAGQPVPRQNAASPPVMRSPSTRKGWDRATRYCPKSCSPPSFLR